MSEKFKAAIKKLAQVDNQTDRAVVISVDKNDLTCVVQTVADDLELEDVKLKPVFNDGDLSKMGLILFPAVGSYVIIGQVDGDGTDVFIISCSEIESVGLDTATALKLLISGDGKFNLNTVLTTFNDGKNGGIPLLRPLTDIINKLQKKVNDLSDAFDNHVHLGVSAGASVSGLPKTKAPARIDPLINTDDIENKKIVQ
jgi:hypothetical protein